MNDLLYDFRVLCYPLAKFVYGWPATADASAMLNQWAREGFKYFTKEAHKINYASFGVLKDPGDEFAIVEQIRMEIAKRGEPEKPSIKLVKPL
jgi:hypothetical protein